MPGNPWPHDMSITIEDRPNILLELLWIREAYELHPIGEDLPPLLLETPPVVENAAVSADVRAGWERAWPRIWHLAVSHAASETDPQLFDAMRSTAHGSPERLDLLRRMVGPDWRETFGDIAFADESFSAWSQLGMDAHLAAMPTLLADNPERRVLTSLIPAWRAGLTKIVTIPCSGDFIRKVGENALLMTGAVRESSDSYRRALSMFI